MNRAQLIAEIRTNLELTINNLRAVVQRVEAIPEGEGLEILCDATREVHAASTTVTADNLEQLHMTSGQFAAASRELSTGCDLASSGVLAAEGKP